MAEDPRPPEDMKAALASVGIHVTEDGKARARRVLAEAAAKIDPEHRAALKAKFGYRPDRAA